jgi:hypothetical protein
MEKDLLAGPRHMNLAAGLLVFLAAFCLTLACGQKGATPADDLKSRILKATRPLTGPPDPAMTKERIVGALVELLDLVVELTPDSPYKPEISTRIGIAKEIITTRSIFDEKARQYLSLAYRMMTEGKKYEPPKELDEFVTIAEFQAKAQKYMKDLVARSLQALEAGRPGETAKLLLEMVLMTMTPVKG